jgi:uncharacterized protein (DUF488 family)
VKAKVTIYTIGHSVQPVEALIEALTAHHVEVLVDVRRFPSSRRHPQFGAARLGATLAGADIEYVHEPELGGHREPRPDSPNTGWREAAFRGYADYMETPAFAAAIERLLDRARRARLVVMCAERAWQSCHRGLIADYLTVRGHEVVHIASATSTDAHPYTKPARIVGGALNYRGLL